MNKLVSRGLLLLATSITVGLASSAIAEQGGTVRWYAAGITNTSVAAGSTNNSHSVTVLNCNGETACSGDATTSSQCMKSATIQVPAGFTVHTSFTGVSASGGKTWNGSLVGSEIQLVASAGTQCLDPGQSVTVTFEEDAPCDAGPYEWTTVGYNGTDFTTAYDLSSSQPSVDVSGTCEPPAAIEAGDFCSYTQGGWGADAHGENIGQILADNFDSVYGSLVVGAGYSMTFDAASDVNAYLPAGGTPNALDSSSLNPTSTSSGVFGGQVTTLAINVDFNDAGIIWGDAAMSMGDLVLQNTLTSLDGFSVAAILAVAEDVLGGATPPADYDVAGLNNLVDNLNNAFDDCDLSDWAVDHLTYPED